jgi:hypothetical protein
MDDMGVSIKETWNQRTSARASACQDIFPKAEEVSSHKIASILMSVFFHHSYYNLVVLPCEIPRPWIRLGL